MKTDAVIIRETLDDLVKLAESEDLEVESEVVAYFVEETLGRYPSAAAWAESGIALAYPEPRIPAEWLALCTEYVSLFDHRYIGRWAARLCQRDGLGWLVFDRYEISHDRDHRPAIDAWLAGATLPAHYFAITPDVARRAFVDVAVQEGSDWFKHPENGDEVSPAIQRALFGTVIY